MRHHHSLTSFATGVALYLGVTAAGLAPLMAWARFCEARKRARRVSG